MKRQWQQLTVIGILLGVWTAPSLADTVSQDNIVIVLDASGSMGERMPGDKVRKIEAAKQALKEVLATVPQTVNIGLLVFSGRNVHDEWIYPLSSRDDERLRAAIDLPEPGNGTPLGAYIKKGADRLLEQRQQQYGYGTYRLLIVTDGEAGDPDKVERYVPEVMARGLTIDVIGVAMNQAHTLATKVHSYRSASDPESLKRAIAEVLAEVGSTDGGAVSEDAFDEVASLPDELVVAVINALSTSGNDPIGSKPAASYRPSSTSAEAPQRPGPPTSRHALPGFLNELGGTAASIVFLVVVIGFVFAAVARRKR